MEFYSLGPWHAVAIWRRRLLWRVTARSANYPAQNDREQRERDNYFRPEERDEIAQRSDGRRAGLTVAQGRERKKERAEKREHRDLDFTMPGEDAIDERDHADDQRPHRDHDEDRKENRGRRALNTDLDHSVVRSVFLRICGVETETGDRPAHLHRHWDCFGPAGLASLPG